MRILTINYTRFSVPEGIDGVSLAKTLAKLTPLTWDAQPDTPVTISYSEDLEFKTLGRESEPVEPPKCVGSPDESGSAIEEDF